MSGAQLAPVVALGCIGVFGAAAPRLARRSPPHVATWLLTVCSVVAAVVGTVVLSLLSLPLIGQDDALADRAHLSASVLRKDSLTGRGVAAVALVLLVLLLGRALARLRRHRLAVRCARRLRHDIGAGAEGFVVVTDDDVDAFAIGGPRGVVVATAGLLRSLTAAQRRAVLAHERSHLRHRHQAHLAVTATATALNPMLWRVPAALSYLVERWADEDAAKVTSRPVTAEALARVAAGARSPQPAPALGAANLSVTQRIAALEAAPERLRPAAVAVPLLLVLAAAVAAVVTTDHVWDAFRLALAAEHHLLLRHR